MVQIHDAVRNNKDLRELPESDFCFHTFEHNEK